MVKHIVLSKLRDGTTEAKLEEMMRETRSRLLRVPGVLSVQSGRRIQPEGPWGFFFTVEAESAERLAACKEHPRYLQFLHEVLTPNTVDQLPLDYDLEPGKDPRLS